jgi:hypothetical protein
VDERARAFGGVAPEPVFVVVMVPAVMRGEAVLGLDPTLAAAQVGVRAEGVDVDVPTSPASTPTAAGPNSQNSKMVPASQALEAAWFARRNQQLRATNLP